MVLEVLAFMIAELTLSYSIYKSNFQNESSNYSDYYNKEQQCDKEVKVNCENHYVPAVSLKNHLEEKKPAKMLMDALGEMDQEFNKQLEKKRYMFNFVDRTSSSLVKDDVIEVSQASNSSLDELTDEFEELSIEDDKECSQELFQCSSSSLIRHYTTETQEMNSSIHEESSGFKSFSIEHKSPSSSRESDYSQEPVVIEPSHGDDQLEDDMSTKSAVIFDKIKVTSTTFRLEQNVHWVTNSTIVRNQSDETLKIIKCELTNNNGYIRIRKPMENFILRPFRSPFRIFFDFFPENDGIFKEELTIDFGTFQLTKSLIFIVFEEPTNCSEKNPQIVDRFIPKKLPRSEISYDFRKCCNFNQTSEQVVKDLALTRYSFLADKLHDQNYLQKMRHMIYLEELAVNTLFLDFWIFNAKFIFDGTNFLLRMPGIQKQKPTLALGDTVQASSHPYKIKHHGVIQRIEQDNLHVQFYSKFEHQEGKKCRAKFFANRKPFQRQQYALHLILSDKGLGIEFLFPKNQSLQNPQLDVELNVNGDMILNGESCVNFYSNLLNKCQKNAVMNVLRGEMRPLPYLIYGPPGTGKTTTVVECINQIARRIPSSKILVAAPSNTVANMIVENLIESGIYEEGEFIRLVSFSQTQNNLIPEHLENYCSAIDVAVEKGKGFQKPIIESYKICVSTLSYFGNLMQVGFSSSHQFTHVIIDEAGQSIEPETLIPISLLAKEKAQVILAGDPKQLGPVVISQVAKAYGYEKSFLERLSEHEFYSPIYGENENEYDCRFVTKLKDNYRSLPSILNVYSHLFYEDELEPKIDDKCSTESDLAKIMEKILTNRTTPAKKCSAYFVNVNGKNETVLKSTSWYNQEEAERVAKLVKQIENAGIGMSSVGIITPYALQVQYLKDIFEKSEPKCDVQVASVESFQGQERDIILVSTVRTNSSIDAASFISCDKRVNVTLSRARAVLVVFGKESLLSQDKNWQYYIQYTKEMGTYVE